MLTILQITNKYKIPKCLLRYMINRFFNIYEQIEIGYFINVRGRHIFDVEIAYKAGYIRAARFLADRLENSWVAESFPEYAARMVSYFKLVPKYERFAILRGNWEAIETLENKQKYIYDALENGSIELINKCWNEKYECMIMLDLCRHGHLEAVKYYHEVGGLHMPASAWSNAIISGNIALYEYVCSKIRVYPSKSQKINSAFLSGSIEMVEYFGGEFTEQQHYNTAIFTGSTEIIMRFAGCDFYGTYGGMIITLPLNSIKFLHSHGYEFPANTVRKMIKVKNFHSAIYLADFIAPTENPIDQLFRDGL